MSFLAEILGSVLERGLVLVLKLEGPPGDRRLLVGFGLPETCEALVLAMTARSLSHHDWWED